MSERREVQTLAALTCVMFAKKSNANGDDDISSGDDPMDWDTDEEEEEDEEKEGVLCLVFSLGTIFRHGEVYAPIEDTTIEFGRRMVIADFNESQCIQHFRFRKKNLVKVAQSLWSRLDIRGTYDNIRCENRYRCPFETALLILLFRFSRPRRYRPEMEEFFGMRISHLSNVLDTLVSAMYTLAEQYLSNPVLFRERLPYYAERIYAKCGLLDNLWGFIDGTLRKTCRPTYFQRHAYSGHKRCHGLKFQTVVTPDGLIACLWGPMNGNRHDSHMLRESNLLDQLIDLNPVGGVVYALYGDPAYPQSQYIFGGFHNAGANNDRALWNTHMSKVREVVEWGYAQIVSNWTYLDFNKSMKIFEVPVGKYYIIGAFLSNLRNTFYSNQINSYFDCNKLTIDEYLELLD